MQVKWLRVALRNFEHEAAYISRDNPRAAAALVAQANQFTALLSLHPDIGRAVRVPGTRELVLTNFPYIIPSRVKADQVEILRVFHTSRKGPPGAE